MLILRLVIGLVATALLFTFGFQIFGAPLTVPALWWAARNSRGWVRTWLIVVATLTMGAVGWFIVYATIGERYPHIVLGPAVGALVALIVFLATTNKAGNAVPGTAHSD